jgi:hypothetical protein
MAVMLGGVAADAVVELDCRDPAYALAVVREIQTIGAKITRDLGDPFTKLLGPLEVSPKTWGS